MFNLFWRPNIQKHKKLLNVDPSSDCFLCACQIWTQYDHWESFKIWSALLYRSYCTKIQMKVIEVNWGTYIHYSNIIYWSSEQLLDKNCISRRYLDICCSTQSTSIRINTGWKMITYGSGGSGRERFHFHFHFRFCVCNKILILGLDKKVRKSNWIECWFSISFTNGITKVDRNRQRSCLLISQVTIFMLLLLFTRITNTKIKLNDLICIYAAINTRAPMVTYVVKNLFPWIHLT